MLFPGNTPMVEAALAEGKNYSAEAQAKKGTNVGSSHARICIQFLKALTEQEDFNKPENQDIKEALTDFW